MKKICVVLPALNEERAIKKTINDIPNPLVSNIVVVDGNSTDKTLSVAKNCKKPDCEIQTISQKGKGKGMAFQTFLNSFHLDKYDIYVMLDADYTYNPKEIRRMVRPIIEGKADVVIGNRFSNKKNREIMPFTTFFGNKLLTFFAMISHLKDPKDVCTGYWAFSKDVLKKIKIKAKNFDLEMNLFTQSIKNGFKIKTVPISYRERIGKSKLRKTHGFLILSRLFKDIITN